jgi:hypothetical protein
MDPDNFWYLLTLRKPNVKETTKALAHFAKAYVATDSIQVTNYIIFINKYGL